MDTNETVKLLRELVALQQQSIRLQKFALSLQSELVAYQYLAATGGKSAPTVERVVMGAVRRMRITAEKVAAGKKLPK